MKITEVKTFLMSVGNTPRNWLFVKVYTDEGITGVGESSGWPAVIKAAVDDISPMVIGEDPMNIERVWQLLYVGMMGHGMTGVVGSGAINGIEMALWDIKGKALGTPVWNLLGGKVRDSVRVYGHAFRYKMGIDSGPDGVTVGERALELKDMGYTAVKTGQGVESVAAVEEVAEGRWRRNGHHGGVRPSAVADRQGRHHPRQGAGALQRGVLRGRSRAGKP